MGYIVHSIFSTSKKERGEYSSRSFFYFFQITFIFVMGQFISAKNRKEGGVKSMQPGMITADRLRRMKCPICGSRDKNVAEIINANGEKILKTLACNQCGHLTMFGIAAAVIGDIITKNVRSADEYEQLVHSQHEGNHPE